MNTAERTQVNAHIDMDVRDELALLAECNDRSRRLQASTVTGTAPAGDARGYGGYQPIVAIQNFVRQSGGQSFKVRRFHQLFFGVTGECRGGGVWARDGSWVSF